MKGKFTKFILWAGIIFTACTEVIELEFPDHQPLLVVNSLSSPDENWRVQVSLSKDLNDEAFYPLIDNAVVELYEEGVLLEQLPNQGNGMYASANNLPIAGTEYTLKVSATGYESVQATIRMPEVPEVPLPSVDYVEDP